jgi:DNA excision repair protein ERCC-2
MALTLSKLFMRTISQTSDVNQTGVSLWTLEDVEKAQAAQREAEKETTAAAEEARVLAAKEAQAQGGMDEDEDEDEYGDGGISDRMLVDAALGV